MARLRRPHLIIILTILATLIVLSSAPQAASHRQRLYDYAFNKPAKEDTVWDEMKWGFQLDMPWYELPKFNPAVIKSAPRNWRGPGHDTFATFYATRNATMSDPYFLAAQQIVYRVLWDPASRTDKHTMTVFVAPFISEDQRDYFRAAGAIVRELDTREFTPLTHGGAARLKDMFTKLEMWRQTDFSKITYLDSDAFPLTNVDEIFDLATVQTCNKELVPEIDMPYIDEICTYAFAGYHDFNGVNAGVMVFTPNHAMYHRVVRGMADPSGFDNGFMEQALLNKCFDPEGPFPPTYIDHAYNGGVNTKMAGEPLYIVHHKLWANGFDTPDMWYYQTFNTTWREMVSFYKTDQFLHARQHDDTTNAHHR